VLARTCAVIRRHRHTLRHLKVPMLRQDGAPALADALAECTGRSRSVHGSSSARLCAR
jgi:hypothetical protein